MRNTCALAVAEPTPNEPPALLRFAGVQSAWSIAPKSPHIDPPRIPSLGLVPTRLVQLLSPAGIEMPPASSRLPSACADPTSKHVTTRARIRRAAYTDRRAERGNLSPRVFVCQPAGDRSGHRFASNSVYIRVAQRLL